MDVANFSGPFGSKIQMKTNSDVLTLTFFDEQGNQISELRTRGKESDAAAKWLKSREVK